MIYRGIAIARETRPIRLSGDVRELLRESTVVAVPVLAWVVPAAVIALLFYFVPLAAAFVQTAIATAGLYVVIRVAPILRSGHGSGRTAPSDD